MWVSQHVVGHASAERGRERHPSGPVMALTGFPPMERYPDYSGCLCKPSALSPFLLITRSPMQTSSAQVLTQTLAQTRDSHGQSSLCISPTSITSLPSSCNPLQASTPFPGIPWVLLGTGQKLLAQAALDTLETVCSWELPGSLQTDSEQGWSDIPNVDLGVFALRSPRGAEKTDIHDSDM